MSAREREVPCPACGKRTPYAPSNRHRPFCSERCRLTDLGGWASESYRIPGKPSEGGEAADEEEPRG